jgi:hypothetical protein
MKTKLLTISLFMLLTTVLIYSQEITNNNILGSIKYSDKTISKKIYTNTVTSIASYCFINDNTVALLDGDEQKIVIYSLSDNSVVKTIYLPYSATDFDYYSNKFYILDYDKVFVINLEGIKESEIRYRKPLGIPFAIEKFKVLNGRNIINISDGTTWEITSNGLTQIDDHYWHYENGYKGRTEKIDLRSFELSVSADNGISSQNLINLSSLGLSDYLATARIISINNNEIALDIETSNDIDNPKRFLVITDITGNLISKTEIPFVYETDIKSPFCKYKSSISYCLSTPDGLYFYEINSQKKQINLPPSCPKKSHFNNNLLKNEYENADNVSKVNKVVSAGTNSVTRTQVYENAYKFRDLVWTATSSNINKSCSTISGNYFITPNWVQVGDNTGVPYKWGGFTDWNNFSDLVKNGKYAGNYFCTNISGGNSNGYCSGIAYQESNDNYIIGVDCSGFVSKCWETTSKYATTGFSSICTNLGSATSSTVFSQLQTGDIVNYSGSHTRLCLSNNPSGTGTFMEASAKDWKVSEKSCSPSELTGYICYKYNNINDARLRLAGAITVSPSTIVTGGPLSATYKIGNYGSESWTGYIRLYIINSEGNETWIDQQGPITLSANTSSNTYSFSKTSISSPAGPTKLEVRVQNSNGNDYGRYYKVGASSYDNPLEFTISGCTSPSQPTISGNSTVCEGSNQNYSITPVSGATSYTWVLPNGWSFTNNGTSVNCNVPTGSAGGTIKVCANNACGSSSFTTLPVTVNSAPTQPGTITGNTAVCQGVSQIYSISSVTGATSYTWSLPSGWSGNSTSTSISCTPGASGGNIAVTANNSCSSSSQRILSVSVTAAPAQPGTITGNTSVTSGNSYPYSISSVNGATSYTWSYNGVIQSGTGNSISLTPTSSGTLSVIAKNDCGNSPPSTLNIVINTLSVSSNTLSLSAAISNNSTITVNSNISWSAISSNQSWLTVSPASGSNNGNLTISAINANTSTTARTATITVSGTGVTSQTITVTQQGTAASLSLSSNTLSLSSAINSNGTITITSNTNWNAISNQTWLTVSPASGSNNGNLAITAITANTGTTARTAMVTVSGTGVTAQTITVTQAGTNPSLSVSSNTLSLSTAISSNSTITVNSNISWSAISSNQSWLTVSPASGSNNGNLTISAISANTSTTARTATITVSGTGVTSQTITVTQQGTASSLSLSGNTLSLNPAINSSGTITITSNTSWTASSGQTWLTVSPTSGSNNGTLTLTATSANTATTVRTATVTVSGTGVEAQTINITQLGTAAGSESDLRMHSTILARSYPNSILDNILMKDQLSDISFSILNSQDKILNRAVKLFIIKSDNSFSDVLWDSLLIFQPKEIKYFDRNVTKRLGNTIKYPAGEYTLVVKSAVTDNLNDITVNSHYIIEQGWGYGGNNVSIEILMTDITTGLVAYYPFNGNANDESGNGNNGTVQGNVVLTTDRFGKANKAYEFPGVEFNYIQVPDAPSLQMNVFTLNAWIYTSTDYGYGQIVQKGRDIENGHYGLYTTSVGGTNLYGGVNGTTGIAQPSIGVWHMVTGSVSGSLAKFYLDGKFMCDTTLSNSYVYSGSDPLAIGMHYFSGVYSYWTYPFKGKIDDIRIYNRSLSDNEISILYNLTQTAINNISVNEILKLYPNPAQTFLRISSPEIIKRIEVCDIAGRVIDNITINSDSYSLNVNSLLKGIYLIKGFTDKGIVTSRFIKE